MRLSTRLNTLSLAVAACFVSGGAWAATPAPVSCSYKNFTIGYEISAIDGPDSNGQYLFAVSTLRCDGTGTVVYYNSAGFDDGYQMGWYTPADIRSSMMSSYLYNTKVFEDYCRLHYIGVSKYYTGTIGAVNVNSYPLLNTVYPNVFKTELHLPVGLNPANYRRDALADPNTNMCAPPPPEKCEVCAQKAGEITAVAANPVLVGSGSKFEAATDFSMAGASPLRVGRTYFGNNPYTSLVGPSQALGNRWRFSLDVSINPLIGTNQVLMQRGDGKRMIFVPSGTANVWISDADVIGKLVKGTGTWTYLDPNGTLETFDSNGRRLSVAQRDGLTVTFTYDPVSGRLTSAQDGFGRTLTFTYNAQNLLSQVGLPDGTSKIQYAYDTTGSLTSVTYPDNKQQQFGYTSLTVSGRQQPALLTTLTDENGVAYASWGYDANGRVVSSAHAGGVDAYSLGYQVNGSGVVTGVSITNPLNAISQYALTNTLGQNKVGNATHPLLAGVSQTQAYDANGNLSSRTDFNGNVTTYSYDLSRNLETQRVEASGKPEQRTISTGWHSYWREPVKVAEPKKLTTYVYNGDTYQGSTVTCAPAGATVASINGGTQPIGVLCKKVEQATTDGNGSAGLGATVTGSARTSSWTYNQYGKVLTSDGPRSDVTDVTTYTYYDAADPDMGKRGNLATITNALGHVTQITAYDLNGNPLTIIDPNGVTTTLVYDLRQRLTSKTVGAETTGYTYDGAGQLTRVTLPDGSFLTYNYDSAHRLTGISDALGNTVTYTLDAMGNRTKEDVKDPGGNLTRTRSRVFDALSRLAQDIGAQSQATRYEYDAQGNRTKVTDPLSQVTVSGYDALNRLIQVTDPNQGQTRYAYDGQDRIAQVTDPNNHATTYTADGLGNATGLYSPDTGVSSKTFDTAGNELTRTDAKGQVTATAYDALNRPTQITYQDGSKVIYTWDLGTNGIGRLGQVDETGPGGTTLVGRIQYAYDPQGRITGETRTVGSVSHSIGYAYSNGQLTGLTTPSGKTLTYTRNAAGQATQVTLTSAGTTKTLASAIAYQAFGGVKSYTDGAGQVHTRSYDQDGRVAGYNLGPQSWLVSYDPAGRITGQVDAGNAANSGIYGYDALDRLTSASLPSSIYGYGYDAVGNRTSQSLGATTRTYTTDAASNRLQGLTNPARSYGYDANGSLTSDGTATFGYDSRGRLAQATTAAGATGYQVNALGQRVKKTVGSSVTIYHYDTAGHLLAESDGAGTLLREYVWLDDTPLAVLP